MRALSHPPIPLPIDRGKLKLPSPDKSGAGSGVLPSPFRRASREKVLFLMFFVSGNHIIPFGGKER